VGKTTPSRLQRLGKLAVRDVLLQCCPIVYETGPLCAGIAMPSRQSATFSCNDSKTDFAKKFFSATSFDLRPWLAMNSGTMEVIWFNQPFFYNRPLLGSEAIFVR